MIALQRLIDQLHQELALHAHPEGTPTHDFAMNAFGSGATAMELTRALGVTK